jgi:hypothetical protein
VKLASRDDPDKSFGPCKRGVVFGVDYDTENWFWSIPDKKRARLIVALKEAVAADEITVQQEKSIVGKLIHIKVLLPATKYNICHIMRLGAAAEPDADQCLGRHRFSRMPAAAPLISNANVAIFYYRNLTFLCFR